MKKAIAVFFATTISLLLSNCATIDNHARAAPLFNDQLFAPPTVRIHRDDVFAVNDEMRIYLRDHMNEERREKGRQQALFNALYSKNQLKLEYDSVMTRNAAEAFAARSGNCLSLGIMTAAFAKEMGLSVRFQRVFADEI